MKRVLRGSVWLALGAILEIALVVGVMPSSSTQPLTPWERMAGNALAPAGAVFGVMAALFGHAIDRLPAPFGSAAAMTMLVIAFLVQAAIFALPFWALRWFVKRRRRMLQTHS